MRRSGRVMSAAKHGTSNRFDRLPQVTQRRARATTAYHLHRREKADDLFGWGYFGSKLSRCRWRHQGPAADHSRGEAISVHLGMVSDRARSLSAG